MFIQTEDTPNPNTLKFLPGRAVMASGTMEFPNKEAATRSPLAENLFKIENVASVFFGADFVSVSKTENADWDLLKPHILATIMDYFVRHEDVEIQTDTAPGAPVKDEDLDEISLEVKDLIETRVRPAVAADGGDIIFEKFEEGIVYLRLQGACEGCPSSSETLKSGIENMLKYYIPEVREVRATN